MKLNNTIKCRFEGDDYITLSYCGGMTSLPLLFCSPVSNLAHLNASEARGFLCAAVSLRCLLHLGADVEVVHTLGAHERQLHVRVRVDAARHHQFVGGVNDPHSRGDLQVLSDLNDYTIFNVDVSDHGAVFVHDFAAFYEDPAGLCHACCAPPRESLRTYCKESTSDRRVRPCSLTHGGQLQSACEIRMSVAAVVTQIKGVMVQSPPLSSGVHPVSNHLQRAVISLIGWSVFSVSDCIYLM